MKWLKEIYKYNKYKERYRMHKEQIKKAVENNYINSQQEEYIKKLNEKYRVKFRHAAAVYDRGNEIYEFYYRTSEEKHEGKTNKKIDEDLYIGKEADIVQFKRLKEFYETFEVYKNWEKEIQKRFFRDEEQQEEFLKRVKEEAENFSENKTDITENYYIEDKLYELAYINKIQENYSEEELDNFEKELDIFIQEINQEYSFKLELENKIKDEE